MSARQAALMRRVAPAFAVALTRAALLLTGAGRLVAQSDRGVVAVLVRAWPRRDMGERCVRPCHRCGSPRTGRSSARPWSGSEMTAELSVLREKEVSANPSKDADDLSEDGGIVTEDGLVGRVVRHEPHVTVAPLEGLDGGFTVDHRGDDIPVVTRRLAANNHEVPVANGRVNHRVADHREHEQVAVADKIPGQGHNVFGVLLGEMGPPRRRPTEAPNGAARRLRLDLRHVCRGGRWVCSLMRRRCEAGGRDADGQFFERLELRATELGRPTPCPISRTLGVPRSAMVSSITRRMACCRGVGPNRGLTVGKFADCRLGPPGLAEAWVSDPHAILHVCSKTRAAATRNQTPVR